MNLLRIEIALLCVGGAILSGVSLYNHYSPSETGYCDFDEVFNCDLVNRSSYARIFGIPVALIGLIGYGLLLTLTLVNHSLA